MDTSIRISEKKLNNLLKSAQWGWWCANLQNRTYSFSDYIKELIGSDSNTLAFEDFIGIVREDHRARIANEFMSVYDQGLYELIYPLNSKYGETWIHAKVTEKETDENGDIILWGFLQRIDSRQEIDEKRNLQRLNNLLTQQNSISHSLLAFLKTEDSQKVIHKILLNILNQFHGSRVYIFEYDLEKQLQSCTFEVLSAGTSSEKENLQSFPMSATTWWTEQLCNYTPIILFNLDELPEEAVDEKEILSRQGIKSLMVVPMIAKDHVWGYLGIDITDTHRSWANEDYQWFASLGNIISICIELHKSEQAARKEREYFKNLYHHMPVGYVRLKALHDEDGNFCDYFFCDINPAFERITGEAVAKYIGKTAIEAGIPKVICQKQLQEMHALLQSQGYRQGSYQVQELNKHLRVILYSTEQDEIIILFSDMTDIVNAHEALDKSEKTLRNIYKNIPVGIEIYDKEGYLKDMNDKDLEIFGLEDKSWGLGVNLFDNPNIPEDIKQKIKKHQDVDFEIKYDFAGIKGYYQTQEQGVKDLIVKLTTLYNSYNELENYMLILIDNTETSTAQHKIDEFENFFSVIADFAKVGYFKWNLKSKTGFALNQWLKNWEEPENGKLEEIVGIYRNAHPDDRARIIQFYENVKLGKASGTKEEIRVRKNDGTWKWIRSYVTVKEYDPTNNNIEVIGVNFDITELKEVEHQLIEAKNKAETLDKLKSAFLANMSHEIRTPLNAIVGFSNLLAETDDSGEKEQYISIIQENNDLLLQLISDVLDLSKIEAGTLEIVYGDVDVNLLCHEIIRSLSLKASADVRLEFENHIANCVIRTDRNRLMQLINNFINNALKFTTQGYIRLGYNIKKGFIEFYVSDTGLGISEEHQKAIFDRFVKLNSFVHGTGLGLSICKSTVEQMGGEIGVESKEGKGSRFWFTLPYDAISEAQEESSNEQKATKTSEKPTILITESLANNFVLVSTTLKKEYKILWAQTGEKALELYQNNHPNLILTDIDVTDTDGLATIRQIRKNDPDTPIIALSGIDFDTNNNNALEAGCNACLSKPVNPIELKATIKKLL